jgi:Mce-associated membrane protein
MGADTADETDRVGHVSQTLDDEREAEDATRADTVAPVAPDQIVEDTCLDREDGEPIDDDTEPGHAAPARKPRRLTRLVGLVLVTTLAVLCGWLGLKSYDLRRDLHQRDAFLQAARTGAEMLTSIDASHVQDDVARIVASATGPFLEDFQNRSQSFIDTVVKVQSRTKGTVLEAGLQQVRGDQADVLVTMSVTTSINGAETQPRQWRMRIGVQRDGSTVKVSNVEFVP